MTDTLAEPTSEQLSHSFRFDKFKIRGATHLETEFTIRSSGHWTSISKVVTQEVRFKPRVTLFVEFYKDNNQPIPSPVGEPPQEWCPKEIWQEDFGKSGEKTITQSGQSDYLAQHFDQLSQAAQARLKMRMKKRPGFLDKLF